MQYRPSFKGFLGLVLTGTVAFWGEKTVAQIVPDDTLGAESSVVVPDVTVNGLPSDQIEGGALRGELLFHSFEDFNVADGRGAYFANPAAVNTIFSRVTGVNASEIFGTLGVLGDADLVFLNPKGILFGPNARLDLRGSFTGSTASGVELPNGEVFSALAPDVPSLLALNTEAPIGLVFEGANAQAFTNEGILVAPEDLTLASNNLDLQGQLYAGQDLILQAQDTVQIRDSESSPFIAASGGGLLVQGDQTVDIFALNHPDSGLFSGSNMTLRSDNPVNGDAHYWSGGSFQIENLDGNVGDLLSPVDPIIRALGDVKIGFYEGSSLHILAGGSIDIGTAIITAPDSGTVGVDFLQEAIELSDGTIVEVDGGTQPTLDVRAGVAPEVIGIIIPLDNPSGLDPTTEISDFAFGDVPTSADITVGDVWINAANGLVLLTNQYEPNIVLGGNIVVTGEGDFGVGIDAQGVGGNGSDVILDSRGNIVISENTAVGTSSISNLGNGGDITFISEQNTFLEPNSLLISFGLLGGDSRITSQNNVIFDANSGIFTQNNTLENGITAGRIHIQGNWVNLAEDTFLINRTSGNASLDDIAIFANLFTIDSGTGPGFGTQIYSLSEMGTEGDAGNINIEAGLVEVGDFSLIFASTFGNGDAGSILVKSEEFLLGKGSAMTNIVQSNATGNGGNITIQTDSFSALFGSTLQSVTYGIGDGGDVDINTRIFSATGGAIIEASAGRFDNDLNGGNGDSGNLTIRASESIIFDGDDNTEISSSARSTVYNGSSGNGGQVNIFTDSLTLINGGRINGSTRGGRAGTVNVQVENEARFQGVGSISGGSSGVYNTSEAVAFDDGGDINISAGSLFITDGAVVSANTYGDNAGGDVSIFTDSILLDRGGEILSSTFGRGEAGNVTVVASEDIVLRGNDPGYDQRFAEFGRIIVDNVGPESGIFSLTDDEGSAGDINIFTPSLNIFDRAEINVSSRGSGISGGLQITARDIRLENQGRIVAETRSGNGGDINLNTQNLLLRNNSRISTTAGTNQAGGDGGNITISSGSIFAVPQENSDISADAFEGDGGRVEISADGIFGIEFRDDNTPYSDITASSQLGNPGTVNINTPDIDPNQGLNILPEEPREIVIADACQTTNNQNTVAFFNLGQGGTPPAPGDLMDNFDTGRWVSLDLLKPDPVTTNTDSQLYLETDAVDTLTFFYANSPRITIACQQN